MDYIGPHLNPPGIRNYTGFKYHAITHGKLHDKWVYDPDAARARVGLHAAHFRGNRVRQVEALAAGLDVRAGGARPASSCSSASCAAAVACSWSAGSTPLVCTLHHPHEPELLVLDGVRMARDRGLEAYEAPLDESTRRQFDPFDVVAESHALWGEGLTRDAYARYNEAAVIADTAPST